MYQAIALKKRLFTKILFQLCKFPFTYKGTTYTKCTTDGSNNGKAWCAYAYKKRYPGDIEVNTVDDCKRSCDCK